MGFIFGHMELNMLSDFAMPTQAGLSRADVRYYSDAAEMPA